MPRAPAACLWFLVALGLYVLSAAPGPLWGDSSKLALYALHGYLPSANPGDHAGFTLLAWAWLAVTPALDAVRALHLLSSLAGAATVALAFLAVSRTADDGTGHTAAAVLLAGHPLWWSAAVTESYAPAAALVLVVALTSTSTAGPLRSAAAGLAAGLAVAVHAFTLFLAGPFLVALPRRRLPAALLAAVSGAAPLWLALAAHPADPLTGHEAGGGGAWFWHAAAFLAPNRLAGGLGTQLALLAFALGPLGVLGLVRAFRRGSASVPAHPRLTVASAAVLVTVLSLYSPFRLHLMVLFPFLALLLLRPPHLPAGLRLAHVVVQTATYTLAPILATAAGFGSLGARELPHRDNAAYFLSPLKSGERGPGVYARELLAACPPHAVVLADFNPGAVLRLVQEREAFRPDVVVIPTVVDEALATPDAAATIAAHCDRIAAQGRPAVLADGWPPYYRSAELRRRGYTLSPCGPGWRVEERTPPS